MLLTNWIFLSGFHLVCFSGTCCCWQNFPSGKAQWSSRTAQRPTEHRCRSWWSWFQWMPDRSWHWTLLCWKGGEGEDHQEGPHSWVYSQECWEVPLHLCHTILNCPGRDLRGELWEDLPDHFQAAGLQWDCQEMLQAPGKGLQWSGSWGVSHTLWILLYYQVCWEAARQICWWYQLWEAPSWDLWCWMCHWRRTWRMPR